MIHFVVLGLLCAVTRNFIMLPYQLIFFIEASTGIGNRSRMNYTLLGLLLIELFTQWLLIVLNVSATN